jgi:nucleotide-binding universal stress UspA family protein
MGRSYTSEIKKFLFGTKSMKVIKECRCPVMMVK